MNGWRVLSSQNTEGENRQAKKTQGLSAETAAIVHTYKSNDSFQTTLNTSNPSKDRNGTDGIDV